MSQYPQSDNQVGEQKIRKNSQKCQFLPKLTFGAYNTTLRCWLNLKHVVLYAGHMYKPFWTTKIWLGRQWGSGKVKIRSNKGQYGAICGQKWFKKVCTCVPVSNIFGWIRFNRRLGVDSILNLQLKICLSRYPSIFETPSKIMQRKTSSINMFTSLSRLSAKSRRRENMHRVQLAEFFWATIINSFAADASSN